MNADESLLTANEFLDLRFDLPESGQWSELSAGQMVHLQPPDLDHGNTILNLSKKLAVFAARSNGYPCFDLGLQIETNPDTVWFPAVSYFVGGPRFAETDRAITRTVPAAVLELASTADRRKLMADRVRRYFEWGIELAWIIDPAERTVNVASSTSSQDSSCYGLTDQLQGTGPLLGLDLPVAELFAEPAWWS
jgi:Uma2 family endonuclease